jgi:hypothetical protein
LARQNVFDPVRQILVPLPLPRLPTATVIMVEPVCRTREILRNCGYVLRAVFPTEVLGASIYSSVIFGGSMVLTNAVREASSTKSVLPLQITVKLLSKSFMEELGLFFTSVFYLQMPRK